VEEMMESAGGVGGTGGAWWNWNEQKTKREQCAKLSNQKVLI